MKYSDYINYTEVFEITWIAFLKRASQIYWIIPISVENSILIPTKTLYLYQHENEIKNDSQKFYVTLYTRQINK
jgi:hypothetical protein